MILPKYHFKDKYNRISILHGVNIANHPKWYLNGLPNLPTQLYSILPSIGIHYVRLLIFWEHIEPYPNLYNLTYLYQIKKFILLLNNLNIKVLINLHQDFFNKNLNGNGLPTWILPNIKNKKPNYLNKQTIYAFSNFWSNKSYLQKYSNLINFLQIFFKNTPNIIGFDIFNEPYFYPILLLKFESSILPNFYKFISANSPNLFPLFYQPHILSSSGLPSTLKLHLPNSFFHSHLYPPSLNTLLLSILLNIKITNANSNLSPCLLSEFGYPNLNHNNSLSTLNLLNKKFINFFWWVYDLPPYDKKFSILNLNTLNLISLPYPKKIAGYPISFSLSNSSCSLSIAPNSNLPSEIFINKNIKHIKINNNIQKYSVSNNSVIFYAKNSPATISIYW